MDVTRKKVLSIFKQINPTYRQLSSEFYVGYSVKQLADKVAYDLLKIYRSDYLDFPILYKKIGNKHKIAIGFEDDNNDLSKVIWLSFDIVPTINIIGDNGLTIEHGQIHTGEIKGYIFINDIEEEV